MTAQELDGDDEDDCYYRRHPTKHDAHLIDIGLVEVEYNIYSNKHVDKEACVVDRLGLREPIVLDKHKPMLIKGLLQFLAAKQLGFKTVPVKIRADMKADYADQLSPLFPWRVRREGWLYSVAMLHREAQKHG
jgi:hypothetical protein